MYKSMFRYLRKILILYIHSAQCLSVTVVRAEDEAMNHILGTQGRIQEGSGRQINSQLGKVDLMGHRRALWGLVILNWGSWEATWN